MTISKIYTVTYYRFTDEIDDPYHPSEEPTYNHTLLGCFTNLLDAKEYASSFLQRSAKSLEHNMCGHIFNTNSETPDNETVCKTHSIPVNMCYHCFTFGVKKNCRMCEENATYCPFSHLEHIEDKPLQLVNFKWQTNYIDPELKCVFNVDCHPALCIQIVELIPNTPVSYLSSFHHGDSIFDDLTFTQFKSWLYCCYPVDVNGKMFCEHSPEETCAFLEEELKCNRRWWFEYIQKELIELNMYTKDMQDILKYIIYPTFLHSSLYDEEENEDTESDEEDEDDENQFVDVGEYDNTGSEEEDNSASEEDNNPEEVGYPPLE